MFNGNALFVLFYNDIKQIVDQHQNNLEYTFKEIISGDTNNGIIKLVFGRDEEPVINQVILETKQRLFKKYIDIDTDLAFSIDKVYVEREDWFILYFKFKKKYIFREWYERSLLELEFFLEYENK